MGRIRVQNLGRSLRSGRHRQGTVHLRSEAGKWPREARRRWPPPQPPKPFCIEIIGIGYGAAVRGVAGAASCEGRGLGLARSRISPRVRSRREALGDRNRQAALGPGEGRGDRARSVQRGAEQAHNLALLSQGARHGWSAATSTSTAIRWRRWRSSTRSTRSSERRRNRSQQEEHWKWRVRPRIQSDVHRPGGHDEPTGGVDQSSSPESNPGLSPCRAWRSSASAPLLSGSRGEHRQRQ